MGGTRRDVDRLIHAFEELTLDEALKRFPMFSRDQLEQLFAAWESNDVGALSLILTGKCFQTEPRSYNTAIPTTPRVREDISPWQHNAIRALEDT